jgi:hypothetical protein
MNNNFTLSLTIEKIYIIQIVHSPLISVYWGN